MHWCAYWNEGTKGSIVSSQLSLLMQRSNVSICFHLTLTLTKDGCFILIEATIGCLQLTLWNCNCDESRCCFVCTVTWKQASKTVRFWSQNKIPKSNLAEPLRSTPGGDAPRDSCHSTSAPSSSCLGLEAFDICSTSRGQRSPLLQENIAIIFWFGFFTCLSWWGNVTMRRPGVHWLTQDGH